MALRISLEPPSGWSRSGDTVTKAGSEQAGSLRLSHVQLAPDTGPLAAGVQIGRADGWGTPLNLGEDECEHGKLAFVSFFGGAFVDARVWIVIAADGSAAVFKWTGDDPAIGDEAEVIVLRTLGLIARPPSVFFGG